jgi:hypothetical protein
MRTINKYLILYSIITTLVLVYIVRSNNILLNHFKEVERFNDKMYDVYSTTLYSLYPISFDTNTYKGAKYYIENNKVVKERNK